MPAPGLDGGGEREAGEAERHHEGKRGGPDPGIAPARAQMRRVIRDDARKTEENGGDRKGRAVDLAPPPVVPPAFAHLTRPMSVRTPLVASMSDLSCVENASPAR